MKLIMVVLMLISIQCFAQDGTLKGVVTYFFNDNYGYKADVGAVVYALNKDSAYFTNTIGKRIQIGWDTVANYNIIQSIKTIKQLEPKSKDTIADNYLRAYNLINIKNKKAWDYYYLSVALNLMMITSDVNKNTQKITVDGNGNYALHLTPGKYIIVIRSSGRNGHNNGNWNIVNSEGQIDTKEVTIMAGKETILDGKFSQY